MLNFLAPLLYEECNSTIKLNFYSFRLHYIPFQFLTSFSNTSRRYRCKGHSCDALNRGSALMSNMKEKDQNSKQTLIVLRSEWAKIDFKYVPIFKNLF